MRVVRADLGASGVMFTLDTESGFPNVVLVTATYGLDDRDPAVKELISRAIQACRKHGKYIGIWGQRPSDQPDLARWLLDQGIDSVSLNPDTVVGTWLYLVGQALPDEKPS